jgi:hypothetical protein
MYLHARMYSACLLCRPLNDSPSVISHRLANVLVRYRIAATSQVAL